MNSPVFLLASERSGTNLLRRRLTEYQKDYFGPAPLHLLKHLYWAEPYYGDLQEDESFSELVSDALGLAYYHFSPWDEVITVNEVKTEYKNIFSGARSSIGVMHVIYTIYAKRKGYSSYFCKDNKLFDFVSDIKLEIPDAKFLYLYRDPRDVVVSQLKRPLQNKSIFHLAELWREEQVKCIRHVKFLGENRDVISISYEDLIENEAKCIEKVCSFLNIDMLSQKSNFSSKESTEIQEWGNIDKPTMKSNSGNFLKVLSKRKIGKIESICWSQMLWLGYSTVNSERPTPSMFMKKAETFLGKVALVLSSFYVKKSLTESQVKQIRYVKEIKKKWI